MKDQYNREIDYIRISVTDRCNLRCKYCIPECGITSVGHDNILRYDEIVAIVEECSKLGIKKVKITGGEPLVRKGLHSLVKGIKEVKGIEQVTLTTNGILLKDQIDNLALAGIDAINISLDTLDREKFIKITGFDALDKVLEAIDICKAYTNIKLKINIVTLEDYNKDEILDLVALAKDSEVDVRFIEIMPIGLGKHFKGYDQEYVEKTLIGEYGNIEACNEAECRKRGNGPAIYYKIPGFKGRIGFISAISHQFCDNCNRVRLTAEGVLKPCLQYSEGVDLKKAIRERSLSEEYGIIRERSLSEEYGTIRERNNNKESLKNLIEKGIYEKPKGHNFGSSTILGREDNLMAKIGG